MPSTVGYPQRLNRRVSQEKLDYLEVLKNRVRYAQEFRRKREAHWKKNERRYMGQFFDRMRDDPSADHVAVNMTFSTVETIAPFITGGATNFLVEPYSGDSDSVRARYLQIYLNRMWRSASFNGQPTLEKAVFDSLLYGDGFINVTWDLMTKTNRDPQGEVVPGSERDVVEFDIQKISPWDVFLDPAGTDLRDCRWFVVRSRIPMAVLSEDKRYSNTKELHPDDEQLAAEEGRLHALEVEAAADIEDYVSIYEFYDKENRRYVTFAMQSDLPLRWVEDAAPTLVQLPGHPIPNMPYHLSEVEQIADLQDELNKTRSQMITHRRRNNAKILYRENRLSDEALAALESSAPMQGVPVQGDEPFGDLVDVLSAPPISSDLYNVSDVIRGDIFEITGVNEYLRGSIPDQSRTATEASIIEGGSNVKIRHKLRLVEGAARQIGQLVLDIAAEAYLATDTEEMSLYLTGREAEAILRAGGQDPYTEDGTPLDADLRPVPSLFKGDYEVFVESGSTELRNPLFREQKFKEMFLVLMQSAPMLMQFGVQLNIQKVLELWLEAAGVDDINAILGGGAGMVQDPQVQQLLSQYGGEQQQQQGPSQEGTGFPLANQVPGQPNVFGVNPPSAPITEDNSGIVPPTF